MKLSNPTQILKWAGGKSKLIPTLNNLLANIHPSRYFEPFAGSAVLSTAVTGVDVHISDINQRLVDFYVGLVEDPESTIAVILSNLPKNKAEYLALRNDFNNGNTHPAALYCLNHTCFNGLYRVNMAGQFNVPYGDRVHKPDIHKLSKFADTIATFDIKCQPFYLVDIVPDALYILDPPYVGGFVSYDNSEISVESLKLLCDRIDLVGSHFVLFNRNSEELVTAFAEYKSLTTGVTNTSVGGGASSRKKINEVLFTNV